MEGDVATNVAVQGKSTSFMFQHVSQALVCADHVNSSSPKDRTLTFLPLQSSSFSSIGGSSATFMPEKEADL